MSKEIVKRIEFFRADSKDVSFEVLTKNALHQVLTKLKVVSVPINPYSVSRSMELYSNILSYNHIYFYMRAQEKTLAFRLLKIHASMSNIYNDSLRRQ